MQHPLPPQLAPINILLEVLEEAARAVVREGVQRARAQRPRHHRGATLRPGPGTPLWNVLASTIRPRLNRRGRKASLARAIGVHRARVGEFFLRKSAMPDAERTLELLLWLSRNVRASELQKAAKRKHVRNTNIDPNRGPSGERTAQVAARGGSGEAN
jgi:hypothetical protein